MLVFKTRQEIANEFGINRKTLERKLKKAGIDLPSGNLSPKYQQIIYNHFGSIMSLNVSDGRTLTQSDPH